MPDSISIGAAYRDQSIVGGRVDNSPIGATTPSTGAFTTLSATSAITATGGVNGTLGATTPSSAVVTTLNATGATTLDGNVAIGNATTDLVGFHGAAAVGQGAALTAGLTTITIADAAGTPDYALSALTTTSPYGLATLAEAVSLLYVIKNLQVRMAEVEQRLEEKGLIAAN